MIRSSSLTPLIDAVKYTLKPYEFKDVPKTPSYLSAERIVSATDVPYSAKVLTVRAELSNSVLISESDVIDGNIDIVELRTEQIINSYRGYVYGNLYQELCEIYNLLRRDHYVKVDSELNVRFGEVLNQLRGR